MAEGKERYGEYKENAFDPCGGLKRYDAEQNPPHRHYLLGQPSLQTVIPNFLLPSPSLYGKVNSEHGWHEAFDCVYIILVDACEGIGQRGGGQKSVDMGSML